MRTLSVALLTRWHRFLALPRQTSLSWHIARLTEELEECRLAKTYLERLSETSDVYFVLSRARYDGCPIPTSRFSLPSASVLVFAYMVAKLTLRWLFYRIAAWICKGDWRNVRVVINPKKGSKLEEVAVRHGIEKETFRRVAARLRWVWPLLP